MQDNQIGQNEMPILQAIAIEDNLISEKEDDVYEWDYEKWYLENVLKHRDTASQKNSTNVSSTISLTQSLLPALNINSWKAEAQSFFNVVMGHCSYKPLTRKHFDAFLKAVGGAKLKMGQRGYIQIQYSDQSVETKYAIPNRTNSREGMPYFIFTIHQLHANGEFPKRTLFDFFRYQLQKAGY